MPKPTSRTKPTSGKAKRVKVKRSVKATIKKLKTKVRQRIENGEPLTSAGGHPPASAIKSREVQMKIAHIETQIKQVETGAKAKGRRLPAAEVRLTNEIASLRKRLK